MDGYVNTLFQLFISIFTELCKTMMFKFLIMAIITLGCIYVVFSWLNRIN
jgi:hypothetical protein